MDNDWIVPGTMQVIDLSHTIDETMPHWPSDPRTRFTLVADVEKHGYMLRKMTVGEHSGTHLGAPCHFGGGNGVDDIKPQQLIVPGVKIDVTAESASDANFLLSVENIQHWEQRCGAIPRGSLVLVQTGWSRYWSSPDLYFGLKKGGMHFPGVSGAAAAFLLCERRIVGIGIDTAGVDGGQSKAFRANKGLARGGAYHLENLTNLNEIKGRDFIVFVGALKIKGGSGSPCRVLAFCKE